MSLQNNVIISHIKAILAFLLITILDKWLKDKDNDGYNKG